MPHLKVKPFETSVLDGIETEKDICTFRAESPDKRVELLGIKENDEQFVLEIRKKAGEYLIRCDKITRPLDSNLIKKVLDKLARKFNMEILHSNIDVSYGRRQIASEYDKKITDFENAEFPLEKMALEVGFGSGRHLLWQARKHPETLFIGVEVHTPSARQVLRQIELQGLENIWVVNYDARLLLEMIPSNRLEAIYVHFPVPWDKKPHRRVISDRFLEESLRVLRPGAFLELRTDSDRYYHYALEVFSMPESVRFSVEKNRALPVISKYEARWRRMEKDIYTIRIYSDIFSSSNMMEYDFSFVEAADPGKVESLGRTPRVYGDYFVHFGSCYRMLGSKGIIVECSFGNFDRPEHKYIVCEEGVPPRYLPGIPVKSSANFAAHQKIGAIIHG